MNRDSDFEMYYMFEMRLQMMHATCKFQASLGNVIELKTIIYESEIVGFGMGFRAWEL